MKIFKLLISIFSISILLYFNGCTPTTVKQTLYLADIDVKSPVNTPPNHVNINKKAGTITFSPQFILNAKNKITGTSKNNYTDELQLDNNEVYTPRQKNINWDIPGISVGADVDAAMTNHFSLFGGIHFAGGDQVELTGGNFGLGFFGENQNTAARLDLGFGFQKSSYDVVTVISTTTITGKQSTDDISVYRDQGNVINLNPFLLFTINTADTSARMNYFFSTGYFSQDIINVEPGESGTESHVFGTTYITTDLRSQCTAGFVMFNPGISYKFNDNLHILFSLKVLKEVLSISGTNDWFAIPAVQFDWQF